MLSALIEYNIVDIYDSLEAACTSKAVSDNAIGMRLSPFRFILDISSLKYVLPQCIMSYWTYLVTTVWSIPQFPHDQIYY